MGVGPVMLGKDADHRGEGPAPACLCPPAAVRGQEAALRREAAQTGQLRRPPSRRVPPPPRDSCREDCRGRARWGGAHLWAGRGQQAWSPRGSLQEASPPAFTVESQCPRRLAPTPPPHTHTLSHTYPTHTPHHHIHIHTLTHTLTPPHHHHTHIHTPHTHTPPPHTPTPSPTGGGGMWIPSGVPTYICTCGGWKRPWLIL